jgi:kynurenine formamidase
MSRRLTEMQFVDLSAPIVPSPPETPELLRTEIEFSGHADGAATIEAMFGVAPELLRDGEGWAVETFLRFGTHNSTHVDAPWHYNSTVGGRPAQTIDQLPLEWFFAPAVVLDFDGRPDDEVIDVADVGCACVRRARPAAARHRARADGPRCLPRRRRLHGARPGRERSGDAPAL